METRFGGLIRQASFAAFALCLFAASCSRPPAAPPPAAAPAAAPQPRVQTLAEAMSLRYAGDLDGYEQALQHLTLSSDATTRRRALALHALLLFHREDYAGAVPGLRRAAEESPLVAPNLLVRVLDAEHALGRHAEAAAVARSVSQHPSTTAAITARLRLPALEAFLGNAPAAATAWESTRNIAIDELTEPDFVAMADALTAAGATELAAATRLRLLEEYPQGRWTEETYAKAKSSVEKLSVDRRLALAGKLSRVSRFDQALALYEKLPESRTQALGARIRALFNSRRYEQLLSETSALDLRDPALLLLRARAAWREDRAQEFLAGLARLEERFPTSREASEAKVLRAKFYVTDVIDHPQAIRNLREAIDAGNVGNDGENIWNLGWTHTLAGEHELALSTFDRYIRSYPDGDWKTNSYFWSAKLLDRLGRSTERDRHVSNLVTEFPFSYYSYRARELWPAAAIRSATTAAASAPEFPDIDAELTRLNEQRIETVRELLAIELNRDAAREMKRVAEKHSDNKAVQFTLADVYARSGEAFRANGVLQREFRQFVRHGGEAPRRFWEILFPLNWWPAIQREAARHGHDPYLLASIIRQESGFEPTTVSNAGAVGLMQIMPQEAPRIGEAAGLGAITRAQLFDPETNIAVGAAELEQKLDLMNGIPLLAIAAYNAGERAVGTWLEKTPVDDIDLFVDSIPFAETRLYVKTVTRNRYEYRRIYESSPASPHEQQSAD